MAGGIALSPVFQFFGNDGLPLEFGRVFTYLAGSTTPTTTWTDLAKTVPNTDPIILDVNGRCVIFGDTAIYYKFEVFDQTLQPVVSAGADNIQCFSTAIFSTNEAVLEMLSGYAQLSGAAFTGPVSFGGSLTATSTAALPAGATVGGVTLFGLPSPIGQSGKVVTSNGTVYNLQSSSAASGMVVYDQPGTFNFEVPADVSVVYVSGCAPGGGASSYGSQGPEPDSGGDGQNSMFRGVSVTPSSNVVVILGAHGIGGYMDIGSSTTVPGTPGGYTAFGSLVLVPGVGGGTNSPRPNPGDYNYGYFYYGRGGLVGVGGANSVSGGNGTDGIIVAQW